MNPLYINARFRVRKNIIMQISRIVPGGPKGRIKVHVGQELRPEDIIGEGETTTGFISTDIASALHSSPETALSYIKKPIGQLIYAGEPLGIKSSLFGLSKKTFFAPTDGILDFYDTKSGILRIKLFPRNLRMASGVFGVVDEVDPVSGRVVIRCMAQVLYGMFGSGKERDGILKVIGSPEALISSRQISSLDQNQILVGGGVIFTDALEKALGMHVSGLISGGINSVAYKEMVGGRWNLVNKKWSDVGITLVVTEGFGSIPIGDDIYNVLKSYDGRFCLIDGNRSRIVLPTTDQNSMIYIRKTRLPKGSYIETEAQTSIIALQVGVWVRVVASSHLGVLGVVEAIDQTPTLLPSGIKTIMVVINTKNGRLRVPYLNLEAII